MEDLLDRPQYLNQLIAFRDKKLIKVVTGIRRCGKSTLFDLYEEYLKTQGVQDKQIIRLNLEYPEYFHIQSYMNLYDHIKNLMQDNCMNYIFIDEVQNVPQFQRAVDGLFVQDNCDVYITGSNAHILSGDLATLLSGRYVEIKMLPLSFKEYVTALGDKTDLLLKYSSYLENSSFPYALKLDSKNSIRAYLESIIDSVILKDIVARKGISDVATLMNITRFAFDNIGNLTSPSSIVNTLVSSGRKISVHTVENYLKALTDSFILYKVGRYDVKGKLLLVSGAKYYLPDIGLRQHLLGNVNMDKGHILENVVYLELLRRGYQVYVGKSGNSEVDFVAIGDDGEEYYQVAWTVEGGEVGPTGKTVLERELLPLDSIHDHNPKYLLTMDVGPKSSHNGIRQLNALDWLLG